MSQKIICLVTHEEEEEQEFAQHNVRRRRKHCNRLVSIAGRGKWCPSPPIIRGLIGTIFPQQGVWVPQVREQGGFIEVLVDVNAKAEFEKKYWKGILDAQGKADGGYY